MSDPTNDYQSLADRAIEGLGIDRQQAITVAQCPDDHLLALLDAAFRVRLHFFGRRVRVHVLRNAKSGLCREDCGFCSQSTHHDSAVEQYPMQTVDQLVQGAEEAVSMGAVTYCMVTSGRGPSSKEAQRVMQAARAIKQRFPALRLCASLGLLRSDQAEALAEAGIDRYNHNLETSPRHFPSIVSTHAFADRVATVKASRAAGMESCCGGIIGVGETAEDRVDLALAVRELGVESVPLNFLDPRPGTPLSEQPRMRPLDCLRALALFRLVHPRADLRVAGGREVVLRTLQPLALFAATSMFTNGYLTTAGAEPSQDWKMITEAGFEPEQLVE